MMETDNSGSPAPKKEEEEEILDLINEMDQNLEPDPELILLSAEVPPSGDKEEDVLDLSEEVLMDEADGEVAAFSEKLTAGGNDAEDDDIMVLDIEVPQFSATDQEPLELSEEALALETSLEDIPAVNDDAALMEETDDDLVTLSDEVTVTADKADDILGLGDVELLLEEADDDLVTLSDEAVEATDTTGDMLDLGAVESLLNESDREPSGLPVNVSAPDIANDNFFDMSELPTLLSDDSLESDTVSGSVAPEYFQHAKDLVQDGFELGEALDAAIDKEMVAGTDLAAALGLGLGLEEESPEKERAARFDSGVPSVPSAQLEAAIERVIDRMLGGKIDRLLATAIEKVVTHEINRVKRLLSETLSDG